METVVRRHEEGPISGYLATFKFYDSKDRRLSIFGRVVEGKLEITVLTLSNTPEVKKKEQQSIRKDGFRRPKEAKVVYTESYVYDIFSRKEGRKKYEEACMGGAKCPGHVHVVDIIDDRPRYTFLKWCNEHYYRQWKEEVTVTKVSYVRGEKFSQLKKEKEEKKTVIIPLGEHEGKSEETA